jgi:hypothetical protein
MSDLWLLVPVAALNLLSVALAVASRFRPAVPRALLRLRQLLFAGLALYFTFQVGAGIFTALSAREATPHESVRLLAEGYSQAVNCLLAAVVFLLVPSVLAPFIRSTPQAPRTRACRAIDRATKRLRQA